MRILLVHNYYQQAGGEDAVFLGEKAILERAGHQVMTYERNNAEISSDSIGKKLRLFQKTLWNHESELEIQNILRHEKPQIVHFTNTFPLISPAAYYACQKAGVPVVQTLQNYRLFCPSAIFLRNGQICEACLGKTPPWPGVLHACYRHSRAQSGVVATLLTVHRLLRTWQKQVDIYVAATEFSRQKYIQGGLPAEKIKVKPNFIWPDPGERENCQEYALFVGRIAPEKGILTMLKAWNNMPEIPLKIAGDGPLLENVNQFVDEHGLKKVEVLGRRSNQEILGLMKKASFLVFPSEWYEGFPVTIVEAFACGLPVIASKLGGMAEIVENGHTGLHFEPGNAIELAAKTDWAWRHNEQIQRMGYAARSEYERKYTADTNYQMLIEIYEALTKCL